MSICAGDSVEIHKVLMPLDQPGGAGGFSDNGQSASAPPGMERSSHRAVLRVEQYRYTLTGARSNMTQAAEHLLS